MAHQHDRTSLIKSQEPINLIGILRKVVEGARDLNDPVDLLECAVRVVGEGLSLDRCVVMLLGDCPEVVNRAGARGLDDKESLEVVVEFCPDGASSLRAKQYQISGKSELDELFTDGKPVPLKDIMPAGSLSTSESELYRFVIDSDSKSIVAFPLIVSGQVIGCLSMHYAKEMLKFSDQVLELGEVLVQELSCALSRARSINDREAEVKVFRDSHIASLIVDGVMGRIKHYNGAFAKLIGLGQDQLIGTPLTQLLAEGQKLSDALRELSAATPYIKVSGLIVPDRAGQATHLEAALSLLSEDGRDEVAVILHQVPARKPKEATSETDLAKAKSAEELASSLSRQLTWERWVRQIVCKLHATLDRDTLLQTVADGFGRALGASRCLIVRTDGPAAPLVTHEYAEPDISPLGLGRTGQFPAAAISYFRHRVAAIPDLQALEKSGELTDAEYEYFADNGIRAMAGAPIANHGYHYGVIVILEKGGGRKWTGHELDMLEVAATQTAVALGHSQAYLQLKDQLFNMNLLGNLTQQLTNTLELVSRGGKTESMEDRAHAGDQPQLSVRELEVLKLIASGLANREIAQRLFLTESTVELHASRIRKKLKVKSRTALVKYACDNGLS